MLEREESTHVLMVKLFRVKSPTKLPPRSKAQHFFHSFKEHGTFHSYVLSGSQHPYIFVFNL